MLLLIWLIKYTVDGRTFHIGHSTLRRRFTINIEQMDSQAINIAENWYDIAENESRVATLMKRM